MTDLMNQFMNFSLQMKNVVEKIVKENVLLTEQLKTKTDAYEETIKEAEETITEKEETITEQKETIKNHEEMIKELEEENDELDCYFNAHKKTITEQNERIKELEKQLKRKQYQSKYKADNKEKIAETNKKYKEEHAEEFKNKGEEVVACGCGKSFRYDNRIRHQKSKHHKNWVDSIAETESVSTTTA